jgi:hypothetical protein
VTVVAFAPAGARRYFLYFFFGFALAAAFFTAATGFLAALFALLVALAAAPLAAVFALDVA